MSANHTIQIINDVMVVLDQDGNGQDCHSLCAKLAAKRQLSAWRRKYKFDYAAAMQEVAEYFADSENIEGIMNASLDEIARKILNIPTISEQDRDSSDFPKLSVDQIRLALRAAYDAGRTSAK